MKELIEPIGGSSQVPLEFAGTKVGKIVSVDHSGRVYVDFPGNQDTMVAARLTRTSRSLKLDSSSSIGKDVVLVFENGDPGLPIIIDAVHSLLDEVTEATTASTALKPAVVLVDGERVTIDARESIEFRCGKASIVLTRAGKILLRGEYILSRASGANCIKGGSIQLN